MLKIFDNYKVCLWIILGLVLASVMVVPFATKQIVFGGFRMAVTPVIVLLPILLGIFYAIMESDEHPKKLTPEKKQFKRLLKAIVFTTVVVLNVIAMIYGLLK